MSNLGNELLNQEYFQDENENNIIELLNQIKGGNLGISLSSFEEIYKMTTPGIPFPVGCVNFDDGKKRFVVSWIDNFSKIGIKDVEEYKLRLRHYPTDSYSVLSLLVGLHNGKVDADSGEDLWYYKECHLDIGFMLTRIKLYQLINCDEILFCLYDDDPEKLDSFGFSLNKKELKSIMQEIQSSIQGVRKGDFDNHVKNFSRASKYISGCFTPKGLPKSREALNVYLKRKSMKPEPDKHNWEEYLSI